MGAAAEAARGDGGSAGDRARVPVGISSCLLGERVRYDLRQKMFNHLQKLSLSYYSRTPVGWIMSRVTSDTDRVAGERAEVASIADAAVIGAERLD